MLLDLGLPRLPGDEVARLLRKDSDLPIVMLTAKASENDRVAGLRLGADDYVVKPFSPRELVARVEAVLRRSRPSATESSTDISYGDGRLRIDTDRREVRAGDALVELTRSEFDLLAALASRPGRAWTRLELVGRIQGHAFDAYERTIDVHVKNLRRKLSDTAPFQVVATVPGIGYKFALDRDAWLATRPVRPPARLAFAALGVGSALLTAVLVNTAFAGRFQDYLDKQQHAQQEQLVALFAADYRRNDAWNPVSLNRIAPTVIMTGSEAELHDASGRRVWSVADANTDAGTPEMHRKMMAAGSLGPPRSLPVVVAGRPVGTLVVRVPQGSVSTVDKEFHSSVNRLLVAGALIAALVALLVGVYTARRATKPITELTSAAGARRRTSGPTRQHCS